MSVKSHDMRDDFGDYFYYDPSSPSFLRWKVDRYTGKGYRILRISKGSVAGWKDTAGYWGVRLGEKAYLAHRVVFALFNPSENMKDMSIDHLDRNRSNNAIDNLRLVSRTINSRNKSKRSGRELPTGVGLMQTPYKDIVYLYYIAYWLDLKGKLRTKSFSVIKYGEDEAIKLATEYREKMVSSLITEGAGYTETHGT